jgi:hypothetical protein
MRTSSLPRWSGPAFSILLLVGGTPTFATTPAQKCAGAKVKASGAAVYAEAKCDQKALLTGAAVDPACLLKTEEKLRKVWAKADAAGACPGDADAAVAAVSACVTTFDGAIAGVARCAAAKMKAAGKRTADKAKCAQRAALTGAAIDPACLAKAVLKFTAAVGMADTLGACTATATGLEALVDACVVTLRPQPVNARAKFGETCNVGPAISFVQPEVPVSLVRTVAVSGVAEPDTNQFRVLGPWKTNDLVPVTWNLGQWTGFSPTGDLAESQFGPHNEYAASAFQVQGRKVGFWDNGLYDGTPLGSMQAGCWFENTHTCPTVVGAAAFPSADSKIRASVDVRIPYDGTVPRDPSTKSYDFVYLNFIFRSTCPGGFVDCGSDVCSDTTNTQLTFDVQLYDGRSPRATEPYCLRHARRDD